MRIPLLCVLFLTSALSYKILVYIPKFALSHVNFMGKIADTLVDAGHDVTALISEIDAKLHDGTKKAKILRISPAEGANHMNTQFTNEGINNDVFDVSFDSYSGMVENAYNNAVSFCIQCRKLLTTPGLVEKLRAEKYDALITESFENCGVGLSHLISPRAFIPVSSTIFFDPYAFGVHYSFITEHSPMVDGRFHTNIWSRINSIWLRVRKIATSATVYDCSSSFFACFTQHKTQHCSKYSKNSTQELLLSRLSSAMPRLPSPTRILLLTSPGQLSPRVPIGGITVAAPKPLDDFWDGILSLRPQTVLVSFGSIAKSVFMRPARKASLLKAFSSFPNTTFIWKYEMKDDFATTKVSTVPNVILTDWMPQSDILADPRLNLFISHAGMASCHEISHFGVPSLLIPIFGDQTNNAATLAHVGIAQVFIKFEMVNSEKFRGAIGEMLHNEKYKTAALRIRDQLAARPTSPVERLVKNVEFAARFGPSKSLRPLNLELSLFQFFGLDLFMALIGLFALILFVLACTYRLAISLFSIRKGRKMQKVD